MPGREVHKKLSEALLDDDCDSTHAAIDYPFRFLGRRHRILFHDPISSAVLGYMADGYKGVVSAMMHLVEDHYIRPRYGSFIMRILDYAEAAVNGKIRGESK
jgi:hypothetical protein